jgi:hypothetical protein
LYKLDDLVRPFVHRILAVIKITTLGWRRVAIFARIGRYCQPWLDG